MPKPLRPAPVSNHPSPENRELAGIIRKLGKLLQSDPRIDWRENRKRCNEVLLAFAATCEKSRALSRRLAGAPTEVGGSEHVLIKLQDDPCRIYKTTFGDNFGCRSELFRVDPDQMGHHFHATGNADPVFYLRRWFRLNSIGFYQTRYEGIIPAEIEGHLPRICVSQPVLIGSNPDEAEIEAAMLPYGFGKIAKDAFLNVGTRVLLTDAAPRNVRVLNGIPIPFDAIAEVPSNSVLQWARSESAEK